MHPEVQPVSAPANLPGVLAAIVETKRREIAANRPLLPEFRARACDRPPLRPFAPALRRPNQVAVIAEIKRRSPSAGPLRPEMSVAEVASDYARGGASALSVLTDRDFFGGSIQDLTEARRSSGLPVLRKDFVIDAVQIWEGAAAGADAVLLIVRLLSDPHLTDLLGAAAEAGLDALVEAHTAEELDRSLAAGATLVGINNRDLDHLRIDRGLSLRLAAEVPPSVTLVAESGLRTGDDVRDVGRRGVDAVLVGESLLRQVDLGLAVAALAGQPKDAGARPR